MLKFVGLPEHTVEIVELAFAVTPVNGSSEYEVPSKELLKPSEFVAETPHAIVAFAGVGAGIVPSQVEPEVFVIGIFACGVPLIE